MSKIILASGSPRRKELLQMMDISFEVITADIDEQIDHNNDLRKEIEKLSYQKANAVFVNHQDAIVIGSDTIVSIDNKVLGKPKSIENAKEMLHNLSGKTHQVITAVTIISKDNIETFSNVTDVKFYELSDEEIENYVESVEPLDKAGAYAIQGKGCQFVEAINGDYYSVMGLPIGELYRRLQKYINVNEVTLDDFMNLNSHLLNENKYDEFFTKMNKAYNKFSKEDQEMADVVINDLNTALNFIEQ